MVPEKEEEDKLNNKATNTEVLVSVKKRHKLPKNIETRRGNVRPPIASQYLYKKIMERNAKGTRGRLKGAI